jgi:hypothetical protein
MALRSLRYGWLLGVFACMGCGGSATSGGCLDLEAALARVRALPAGSRVPTMRAVADIPGEASPAFVDAALREHYDSTEQRVEEIRDGEFTQKGCSELEIHGNGQTVPIVEHSAKSLTITPPRLREADIDGQRIVVRGPETITFSIDSEDVSSAQVLTVTQTETYDTYCGQEIAESHPVTQVSAVSLNGSPLNLDWLSPRFAARTREALARPAALPMACSRR